MDNFDRSDIVDAIIAAVLAERTDIDIHIVYSNDLYSDAIAFCENPIYVRYLKGLSPREQKQLNAFNGAYLLPKDLSSKQYILVSMRQKSDGYSYFSTIAHEVQHSKNHTVFCEKYCNGDFNGIAVSAYNPAFQIWDEFAARRTGHRWYLAFTFQQLLGYSRDDTINILRDEQLPVRIQEIKNYLTQENPIELYKNIGAIFGMFRVWEIDYNIDIMSNLGDWCRKLYMSLIKYDSVSDVDFPNLYKELQELWEQHKGNGAV